MLRFSNYSISGFIQINRYHSFQLLASKTNYSRQRLVRMIIAVFCIFLIFLWVPWTQNIRAKGQLIALSPDQRPQTIQTVIAGQIDVWYIQEGDFVKAGDTIVKITEVKDEYFDPLLLDNTRRQIDSKKFTQLAYKEKANAIDDQLAALQKEQKLKLEQVRNKVQQARLRVISDSMDWQAEKINFDITKEQFQRFQSLYKEGLKSLTDLENRKLKWQEAQAKLISQENKFLSSSNELINNRIEYTRLQAEFADKIAKYRSEKFSASAGLYDTEALISKMENQYANFEKRTSLYYITAPQDGYVTQAIQAGIGEIVKEGTEIVSIMPAKYDVAVQMYVKPIDLPLIQKGQRVMIQFDGWPAIIFSGWPGISYGTYIGEVFAIDNFISPNNLYRVLVIPKAGEQVWPQQLKVGMGVKTISFLNNVWVWYEVWRQINGFPPDYYQQKSFQNTSEPGKIN